MDGTTDADCRTTAPRARLEAIGRARRLVLQERRTDTQGALTPWIERSWRRCLQLGHAPQHRVAFDAVPAAAMRRAREGNDALTRAAHTAMRALGEALAHTRYFAILTNAEGVVIDVNGPIDRADRRADAITRVGVDLSERSVGTTAIGAALCELRPVWLHRGEHFFDDTAVYSCAGAPLFGPHGGCVGMLDLTGIDAPERPELLHLATATARSIENTLLHAQPHAIVLRLAWPGHPLGVDGDALLALDGDGIVTGSNGAARQLLPQLQPADPMTGRPLRYHAADLFALPFAMLFDAARRDPPAPFDVPLWSGLRVRALACPAGSAGGERFAAAGLPDGGGKAQRRLRDIEADLIRRTVQQCRGNVAQAALRLGVSRATVYRKLVAGPRRG